MLWKFSLENYLQFLNTENFAVYGDQHVLTIEKNISSLLTDLARDRLSSFELFCLLSSCCLHDIGMIAKNNSNGSISIVPGEYHIRAKKLVNEKHYEFHLNRHEAVAVGEICYRHGVSNLNELHIRDWSVAPYGKVNVSFLAALLRIGDLLDLSYLRVPGLAGEVRKIKGLNFRYWNLHSQISNIKIDHPNREVVIFATADNQYDLSNLFSLRKRVEEEFQIVKEIFRENGIFLDKITLRTNIDRIGVLPGENPFLKLASFDWAKHLAFFGRGKEISDIKKKITDREIVILVGESGVGKTSLLNAGLKQRLIEAGIFVFDTRISNTFKEDLLVSLKTLFTCIGKEGLPLCLREISSMGVEIVIFIDQFEEFFTIIGEKNKRSEILDFIGYILCNEDITTKIVLSLGEDFLAELWEVSDSVPALYDRENTYRLKRLNRENAEQIIVNTLSHIGYSIENDFLEKLLDDFNRREEGIYPPYIQIVCHEVFKKHKMTYKEKSEETPLKLSTYEKLGGSEKIIDDYFEEILDGFTFEERTVINEILAPMITYFHTKQRITYEQILKINNGRIDIDKTLNRLIKQRIIKKIQTERNEYELILDFLAKKIVENKPKRSLSSKIKKAIEYIAGHFNEPIPLHDIAAHVGVSREHFCRLFKVETGRNFIDYLNEKRVEEARKYLEKEPRIKLNEVYPRVGFTNPQHFTKVFRGITGFTPKEYKRMVISGEI